jgi:NADPH-dependent 2,4-dienoyl-CoA reductase/sulfur reductase-like enzyme
MQHHDVVIIGGGPAGLAAAGELARLGGRKVVVVEREPEAGGVPRHCGHLGFGWQSHRRLWSGPRFAAQLRDEARGFDLRTGTTVLKLQEGGGLLLRDSKGTFEMAARRVLIATGARETPRSARLIGGARPPGVMNTGALQQHVYFHGRKPFDRPVIIGSEWVSFSALLTCRHLGIKPVAMIEETASLDASGLFALGSSVVFGVPVLRATKLLGVEGRAQVEAVLVRDMRGERRIACDGVILTGRFRPENALYTDGPFASADLAPSVDANFRCSDPAYFAVGNVLRPLKSSGACWRQGVSAGHAIAGSLP